MPSRYENARLDVSRLGERGIAAALVSLGGKNAALVCAALVRKNPALVPPW